MKTVNLGDICDIIGGGTPSKENPAFYKGSIPWATVRDMRSEVVEDTEYKITKDAVKNSATNIVPKGNVVIATRVGLGKVCFLSQDTAINQDLKGIIPKNLNQLDVRFLFWWFQSVSHLMVKAGTGATVQGVKLPFVKALQIPVFSLPEQERIVAILDEAFAGIDQAIASTEKNLAAARELFESTLNTIFAQNGEGRTETTLGKICDFQNGFAFKSTDAVAKSNVQLIRMGNLYQNRLDLERKPSFYPDSFATGCERYELQEGDLIMSLTGTVDKKDYGFTVMVPASDRTLLLNQRIAKFINLSDDIDKDYLLYLLRSRMFLDQLYASASGTRQANLSTNKMKEIVFCLPDVPQQLEIVKKIKNFGAETQQLETIYQQKLSALSELKKSLLQKAFSGELTTDAEIRAKAAE